MNFSGTGSLVGSTLNNITLKGIGVPKYGGGTATFTIYAEYSNSSTSSTCTATITPLMLPVARANVLGFGFDTNVYGFFLNKSGSRYMVDSPNNFGTSSNSIVQSEGIKVNNIGLVDMLTESNFLNAQYGLSSNPDIIVNGYWSHIEEAYSTSKAVTDALVNYLKTGVVVVLFDEYKGVGSAGSRVDYSIAVRICKRLFPEKANSITGMFVASSTADTYPILSTVPQGDDILDGPFSVNNWTNKVPVDLRGKL